MTSGWKDDHYVDSRNDAEKCQPVSNYYRKLMEASFSCSEKKYDFLKPPQIHIVQWSRWNFLLKSHLQCCASFLRRQLIELLQLLLGTSAQYAADTHQIESLMAFAVAKEFEWAIARFRKDVLFLAFLALDCRGIFIHLDYGICCECSERKGSFMCSEYLNTCRNDEVFISVCVLDFDFEQSGALQLKRAQKGEASTRVVWLINLQRHLELLSQNHRMV